MRQERNNEIDLMLRRLSRRQGVSVSDGDAHNGPDHLDADELSSYAENALPAVARARYTEHLAECSRCRELVVQLSASVPVVAAKQTVNAVEPSVLRKFLASFFSPMVLRYAVPALGLIVVAAIGFVIVRSDRQSDSVAQLKEPTSTTTAPVQNDQAPPASSGFHSPGLNESQPQAAAKRAAADTSGDVVAPVTPNATPAAAVADKTETKAVAAPVQKTDAAAATANEPPPAAPKPAATVDEMRVNVEGRKPAEAVHPTPGTELARQRVENFKDKEKKPEELQATSARRAAKTGTSQTRPQGAGGGATTGTFSVAESEKDRNDGVIRSVGGRRFRRQSGVWVDTAYDSGSTIVNVTRASEQYRALVGDEPGIKNIADQLEATIIVVWKGRTYRIR